MGILDILKRGKTDKPPEAKAGFPELPAEKLPPLPETSLPPLPQNIADRGLPKPPAIPEGDMPKGDEMKHSEIPKAPEMPVPPSELKTKEENKALPETPSMDMPELPETEMPEIPAVPDMTKEPEMPENLPEAEPSMPKAPEISHEPKTPKVRSMHTIPEYKSDIKPEAQFPTPPVAENVPEKIPPLEGIGEVPDFKTPPRTEMTGSTKVNIPKRQVGGPIFVKVSSFKDMMTQIEDVLAVFKEEDDIFFRVTDIKNSQDKKYEGFRQSLEDLQRKLLFVDKTLFET